MNGFKIRSVQFCVCVLSLCFTSSSCNKSLSGIIETRTETIRTDYQVLEVSSAIEIEYSSSADKMDIAADRDLLPYIVTERNGRTFEIRVRRNPFNRNPGQIKIVLPASSDIKSISLSGASSLEASEELASSSLELSISGASELSADVDAAQLHITASGASRMTGHVNVSGELNLNASGASSLEVSGVADKVDAEVSGASCLSSSASRISAETVTVEVSGASRVFVNCTGSISGSVTGASSVRYGRNAISSTISCTMDSSASAE